jgi:lysophospholipid acyltransferase (LPLAT)-like uncharacterized protein
MSGASPMSKAPTPKSAVVVPHKPQKHQKLASILIVALAKLLMKTWRIEWDDRSGLFNGADGPLIFCIWHNRLALSMAIYQGYVRKKRPAQGLAALISASKDGGLLADVLGKFEVQSVRGSTSRRGPQALLEATGWTEKGFHIAITPDGPRGPCYKVQDGIIALARVSGLPILPVGVWVKGKMQTKSWDKFQIPFPFAKCKVTFGQPISVPREASEAERGKIREQLERAMMELTET